MQSFADLYKQHYKRVYNFSLCRLRNSDLAMDVTQEAFLRAYEKFDSLRYQESFIFWILTITLNIIRNMMVRDANRFINLDLDEYNIIDYGSPEDEVIKSFEALALRKAISNLPDGTRQMVIMRYYYFLSEKQICAALNIPIGTVKSRLYRIRQSLLKELEKEVI
jgi:RNA polymerase sigma-70 factor (ECF subfamily)